MAQYIVDFKVLQWSLVQEGKDKTNIWCSVNIASNYQEHNVSALNLSFQEKELLYQSLLRNSFFSLPVKIMPEKIFDDAGLMTREAFAGDTYTLSFILPNTNKTIKAVGIDYVYGNIELDSFWNILELTKLVISNHSEDISSVQNNAGR